MNKKGFTLLEVLLSIAIIAILAGLSMPVYQSFQVRNDLVIAANTITSSLRRAQILSQSVDGDSAWGVNIDTGTITIFKGPSYTVRDDSWDEIFSLPFNIELAGDQEIIFNKFTGNLNTDKNLTLTSVNNDEQVLTINKKGIVDYQ